MSNTAPTKAGAGWYLLTSDEMPASSEMWFAGRDKAGVEVRIPLRGAGRGRFRRVVPLARPTHELQILDRGKPVDIGFQLEPIGKRDAARLMLDGLRRVDGSRDWPLIVRTLWRGGLRLLAGDSRGSGEVLVAAYLGRHADGAPCTLRSGLRRRRAWWAPLEQLRAATSPGEAGQEWETLGDDPKMLLVADGMPVSLPQGWYLFESSLARSAGQLIGLAFYPEYEAEARPDDMIALPAPGSNGRVDVLVMFKHRVRRLRFDPTCRQARFSLREARLRRIGKGRALLRMLSALGDDGRVDWVATARRAGGFLREAQRAGLSSAANDAFFRYRREQSDAVRNYAGWVRRYDAIGPVERSMLGRRAGRLENGPKISILLPIYETPERWLRACIESVLDQAWPDWELCVVDDASPSAHVRRVVEDYAREDPRIRLMVRPLNGHISAASNSALEMASGEYVALLDHDDLLRPHALLEVAESIVDDAMLDLIYSDEDKVDEQGRRFDPYFKPDWNPDLLLGQNYVCHLTVLRTSLARAVGGFRVGFEGSQDHDLVLRCSQQLSPERVRHIPKVLYHWRAIPGSTALRREAKDYAGEAGARAVQEHVRHESRTARVEELEHGHYRVRWPLPDPVPRVSLIVPTRDRPELLRGCVESLLSRTDYPDFELLLVDNGSREPEALALLAEYERRGRGRVRVLRDDSPFNYSSLNNRAAREATGSVLALVNNDIEVITPDWLLEMVGQAMRPGVGAVGAMLLYPDETIQHAGVVLGLGGIANHAWAGEPAGIGGHGGRARVAQAMSAVTGACLVVRKALYLQVGGLDERLQVAFNDIDFCLRLGEAGYRCVWTPFARLYHHESATRGADVDGEKRTRFLQEIALMQERWGTRLERDPAYNPNLTLTGRSFELADPPRA